MGMIGESPKPGGMVYYTIEREIRPGSEVVGSIPATGVRSILVGSVSV